MPEYKLGRTRKSHAVREWLLGAVQKNTDRLVSDATNMFNLTRQTIHKHLSWLVENDYLIAKGATRSRKYQLGDHRVYQNVYSLEGLDEHTVHQQYFSFIFQGLPENIAEIYDYGFSEMVNNAIDHSEGRTADITVASQAYTKLS